MKKICSKKGCNELACYKRNDACYYCPKHYRFCYMRKYSASKTKLLPTHEECEILLYIWCPTFCCPVCNIKLKWHSDIHGRSNVVTIQHNRDGTMMFICHGCNCGHSRSKLGDAYFKIPRNKKYCYLCEKILLRNKFSKSITTKDKLQSRCKECNSLYKKTRDSISSSRRKT